MREIKFRAWDKRNNRMWAETLTPKEIFDLGIEEAKECLTDCLNPSDDFENVIDDLELMQFTGLHDRNGKEIYEGDIVKGFYYQELPNPENEKKVAFEIFGEVKWADGYYSFGGKFHPDIELEVIGNIHQNPELLK